MVYKTDNIKKYIIFLVIGIAIYFGRDTLTYYYFGLINSYIVLGSILVIMFFLSLKKYTDKIIQLEDIKYKILCVAIASMAIIISMIINDAFSLMYFTAIFALCFAVLLSCVVSQELFFKALIDVMSFFVISSLIGTYVLDDIIHIHSFVNSAGLKFNNLFLCGIPEIQYYIRNFGIFREPGVYQFFILISLYYLLMLYPKKDKWLYINIIILVIGLISTFSISGYASFIILLCAFFIGNLDNVRNYRKQLFMGVIFTSCIILVVYYYSLDFRVMIETIIYKINNLGLTDPRIRSMYTNIELFLQSPLVGNDINYVLTCIPHNTSSLLVLFSAFGLIPGALYVGMFVAHLKMLFKENKNIIQLMLLIMFWFVMLNNQCIVTNIFLYAYPIFLYEMKREKSRISIVI